MGVHSFDSILIHRMDPESSYLLNIRLSGNPKKRRKEFACFHISKVINADRCNFKNLVEEIVDAYPHGYNEIVTVFTMMSSKRSSLKSQQIKNFLQCSANMFIAR